MGNAGVSTVVLIRASSADEGSACVLKSEAVRIADYEKVITVYFLSGTIVGLAKEVGGECKFLELFCGESLVSTMPGM